MPHNSAGNGPSSQCSLIGLSEGHIPHMNWGVSAPHIRSWSAKIRPNLCKPMTSISRQLPKYCIVIFSLNIDISAYVWIYFHCNSPRSKIPERGVESPQKLRATRFSKIGKNSERLGMQESTNLCAVMVPYLKYFLLKSDWAQKAYGYLTDKEQSKF